MLFAEEPDGTIVKTTNVHTRIVEQPVENEEGNIGKADESSTHQPY